MKNISLAFSLLMVYPYYSLGIIGASLVVGILEGVSIAAMLPILEVLLSQGGIDGSSMISSGIWGYLRDYLSLVGLQATFSTVLLVLSTIIIFKALVSYLAMSYIGKIFSEIAYSMRKNIIAGLFAAKLSHLESIMHGSYLNTLNFEIPKAASTYRNVCVLFSSLFQVIILFVVLFFVSIKIALGVVLIGVILVLVLGRFIRYASQQSKRQVVYMDRLLSRVSEILKGLKLIKGMDATDNILPVALDEISILKRAGWLQIISKHALTYFREPIVFIFMVLGILIFQRYFTLETYTILGSLMVFMRLSSNIGKLQSEYQLFLVNSHYFHAYQKKTTALLHNKEIGANRKNLKFNKRIELKNISFAYGANKIFENCSAVFPKTGLVSIQGSSGIGKSTLFDIILGFLKLEQGNVLIDSIVMTGDELLSVRSIVGYVQQETFIFHDTLLNNIRMNNKNISKNDVEEALKQAHAYDFVMRLPKGLNSSLGDGGMMLSGGQRQRIALARAIVKKPKVLLLDEATSALDAKTAVDVLKIVKELSQKILVISISHHSLLLENSDICYEIQGKRLMRV